MIETISISDTASYGSLPEILSELSQFNFIFGTNGTGKTTISRIIADENHYSPNCQVQWKNGARLETFVYNRDFVEKNFHQSDELKGVFTLGEQQADMLNKIAVAKKEQKLLQDKLENLKGTLSGNDESQGKIEELTELERKFTDKCWEQKQRHDERFQKGFEGYRNSTIRFRNKILQESNSNSSEILSLEALESKASMIFGQTPVVEQQIIPLKWDNLIAYETDHILKKRVIGKNDVSIAAMVNKLNNSDWVREGRNYFDANDRICPFCQQDTSEGFAKSLNEYFDESFEADNKAIDNLITNYSSESSRLQQELEAILGFPSQYLDADKLKSEKQLLDSQITLNLQRLREKKKEPSKIVELESVSNITATITTLLTETITQIEDHNQTVRNLSHERTSLKGQIWKFLIENELKNDIAAYKNNRKNLESAIENIRNKINLKEQEIRSKVAEIRELEKQTTSIRPTIDGINRLLTSFGFRGFSLAATPDGTCYKLIRPDGSDAKETLSEGEKTFVTFLYFYHLLKGSNLATGITTDRIVVFDDPVSSLDSNILFIVGYLIKDLINEVRTGNGWIKQIFFLTHNVYFHKEVTYNKKRCSGALPEETFWVIRKLGDNSKVEKHMSNPIQTSYELLWSEVKTADHTNLTIQNTLRRILENYFKFFGGIDPKDVCCKFSGVERMICNTLLSWVNDGSHYAQDDLYVTIDDSAIETYLSVFKAIFYKSDHRAHYDMMMGI